MIRLGTIHILRQQKTGWLGLENGQVCWCSVLYSKKVQNHADIICNQFIVFLRSLSISYFSFFQNNPLLHAVMASEESFWPLIASMTSIFKTNSVHVTIKEILNKISEIKLSIVCMVWPWSWLFQDWTFVEYWWDATLLPILFKSEWNNLVIPLFSSEDKLKLTTFNSDFNWNLVSVQVAPLLL